MSYKKLKMTGYFENKILKKRPEFVDREDDVLKWIDHPHHFEIQADGRIKLFARDTNGKFVRIILENKETIHNIFYDRDYTETSK